MNELFRGIEFKVQSPQFEKASKNGRRIIRGYASTDDLDRQNEIISKEALEGAKTDLLNNVTVFMEHQHSMLPIGKVTDCTLDNKGLLIEVSLSKAKFVDDIWTLIEERILNSFSIGGVVLDGHDERGDNGKAYHVIDKISILEVSVVGLPANPAAKFEPVYKSFNSAIVEQIKQKEGSVTMAEQDKKEIVKSEESQEEVVKVEEKVEEKEVVVEKEEEVKEEVVEEKEEEEAKVEEKVEEKEDEKEVVVEKEEEVVSEEEVKVEEKVDVEEKEEEVAQVSEEAISDVEAPSADEVVEKSDEASLEEDKEDIVKDVEEEESEKSTDEKILDALALIIEKLSALDKKEIEEKHEEPEDKKEEVIEDVKEEVIEEKEVVEVKAVEKVEVEKKLDKEEEPTRKSIAVVVPSPYDEAAHKSEESPEETEITKNSGWSKLIFGKK